MIYTHLISFGGHRFTLTERNVFDFGRVINFSHMPGIVLRKDNDDPTLYISNWKNNETTWQKLNDAELKAYRIVNKYGKFACAGIRM